MKDDVLLLDGEVLLANVIWLSDEGRFIPNYGMFEKGAEPKLIPADVAELYIKQGLMAKAKAKDKVKKLKEGV